MLLLIYRFYVVPQEDYDATYSTLSRLQPSPRQPPELRLKHNFKRNRAPSSSTIILVQIDRLTWHLRQVKSPQHLRYGEPDFALCNDYTGADAPASAKSPVVAQVRISQPCRLGRRKAVIEVTVRLPRVVSRTMRFSQE